MKEQKQQQEKEKEKDTSKKKAWWKGEKKFYLFTALGCAAALAAIVVVAVAVSGDKKKEQVNSGNQGGSDNVVVLPPDDDEQVGGGDDDNNDNEQVVVTPEGMTSPIQTVNVLNEYGFYHNTTLNWFYEHKGVDFVAEAGTEIMAAEAGVIESISQDDVVTGTEIVIDHGDGLKTVYRFVTEVEGLKAGDSVEKGEVIATVAEANGNEYKDGAHLHFEVLKDDVHVDPTVYLTLEEK